MGTFEVDLYEDSETFTRMMKTTERSEDEFFFFYKGVEREILAFSSY